MIIAIDGPAASGKGTVSKKLAAHFGLRHLDTGLLYRAVAKALLDAGHAPADDARAVAAAKAIDPARFDEAALKRYDVGEAASVVSAIPGVRAALFNFQQEFAAAPLAIDCDGLCSLAQQEMFYRLEDFFLQAIEQPLFLDHFVTAEREPRDQL